MNRPRSSTPALVVIFAFALIFFGYCGTYVWARVTHRLVNYGSFIARPNAGSGIGWSDWEIAFFPLIELERVARLL